MPADLASNPELHHHVCRDQASNSGLLGAMGAQLAMGAATSPDAKHVLPSTPTWGCPKDPFHRHSLKWGNPSSKSLLLQILVLLQGDWGAPRDQWSMHACAPLVGNGLRPSCARGQLHWPLPYCTDRLLVCHWLPVNTAAAGASQPHGAGSVHIGCLLVAITQHSGDGWARGAVTQGHSMAPCARTLCPFAYSGVASCPWHAGRHWQPFPFPA